MCVCFLFFCVLIGRRGWVDVLEGGGDIACCSHDKGRVIRRGGGIAGLYGRGTVCVGGGEGVLMGRRGVYERRVMEGGVGGYW